MAPTNSTNPTATILKLLGSGVPITTSAIATVLNKPVAAANSTLTSLERKGVIKSTKTDAGLVWELGRSPKLDSAPAPTPPKSRRNNWPLLPGTPIFPRVKINSGQFGLREIVDGKAIISGPAKEPGYYKVKFEGEDDILTYGPVRDRELADEA